MCSGERAAIRDKKTGNSKSAAHEFLNSWNETKIITVKVKKKT
jgi:hypothetical protein